MTQNAEDLRDYMAIQLRFAEEVAKRCGKPLAEAVLFYTNIYRRLGLGVAGTGPTPELWREFTDGFEQLTFNQRVDRAVAFLAPRIDGSAVLLPGRTGFGCFACEAPDADGMVRIHFGNRESGLDVGPLHSTRYDARRAELTEMFRHVSLTHPSTKGVIGGSWLYNLEAYRRLFPRDFADSRNRRNGPASLHGLSSWGQFIDFRGRVRPVVRDALIANLPDLDPEKPWLVFPYQVLFTQAPFAAFRAEYGV